MIRGAGALSRRLDALEHPSTLQRSARTVPWSPPLSGHLKGVLGGVLGVVRSRVAARARPQRILRELPVAAELLAMAVASGLTIPQAVRVAARFAPPVTAAALVDTVAALDLGLGTKAALERLATTTPELAGLAHALTAGADLGVGVAETLSRMGADARVAWRRSAEARARTAPVRLLFPLIFLVLPAFALLGVAPALLTGLSG